MTYLYHGVPENMQGDKLVPLNTMLQLDPDLQAKYLEKYKGREEMLKRKIPLLDCLWNDVVQLLPLHPKQLFLLQKQLGLITDIPDYTYFQINPSQLDPNKTVVYFKTAPGEENVTVQWLHELKLEDLQEIPEATRRYYEGMVGSDEPVFNYQFVPHVMYRGTIDVADAKLINLG